MRKQLRSKRGRSAWAGFVGVLFVTDLTASAIAWEWRLGKDTAPQVLPHAVQRAAVPVVPIMTDPAGDDVTSSGKPRIDLVGVKGGTDGLAVTLHMTFSLDTVMDQVGGYIGLDTDQNSHTGVKAYSFSSLDAGQDIGADFVLDLFDLSRGGRVKIYTTARTQENPLLGRVPATLQGQTLQITVPLSILGDADGNMDVAMVLGNASEPTDGAPNTGHGTIVSVGGSSRGIRPRQVVCENITTGQRVTIEGRARSWDCEAAGLLVKPGDQIRQSITGRVPPVSLPTMP